MSGLMNIVHHRAPTVPVSSTFRALQMIMRPGGSGIGRALPRTLYTTITWLYQSRPQDCLWRVSSLSWKGSSITKLSTLWAPVRLRRYG